MPGSPVFGSPTAGSPIRIVYPAVPELTSPITGGFNYGPSSPATVGSPSTLHLIRNPLQAYSAPFGSQANAGGTTLQLINSALVDFAPPSSQTFGYPSF